MNGAFTFALLAAGAAGVGDFFGGLATRRAGAISVMFLLQCVAIVALIPTVALFPTTSVGAPDLLWGAAAGAAGSIGLALLYHGLAFGLMSSVAPVTAVTAAAVPVIAGVLLGERPSFQQALGVGLAIIAIGLITRDPLPSESIARPTSKQFATAVTAGVMFGAFFVMISFADPASGAWPLLASRIAGAALFVTVGVVTGTSLWPVREAVPIAMTAGVLDVSATVLFLMAVYSGPLALVAVLASFYPVGTVLLARIFLRERFPATRTVGFGCAILAVWLIIMP
jgi:uncharacterized membrane protein